MRLFFPENLATLTVGHDGIPVVKTDLRMRPSSLRSAIAHEFLESLKLSNRIAHGSFFQIVCDDKICASSNPYPLMRHPESNAPTLNK
jgi:hypothetical protein